MSDTIKAFNKFLQMNEIFYIGKENQHKAFKEFKNALFNQYKEYPLETLENIFNSITKEMDCDIWLLGFEEAIEEFIEEKDEDNYIKWLSESDNEIDLYDL